MSALVQSSYANETTPYFALANASGGSGGSPSNWYLYPAGGAVDLSQNAISNCTRLEIDEQVLTANASSLFLNGVPVATISNISNVSDWALYPALANINANNFAIQNLSGLELDGNQVSTLGDTILVNGLNPVSNWSAYSALTNVNLSNFAISNVSGFQLDGQAISTDGLFVLVNGSNGVERWSQFPAIGNVNLSGHDIINADQIDASGISAVDAYVNNIYVYTPDNNSSAILTSTNSGATLLLNSVPLLTSADISSAANWATYPASANVNMSGSNILNASQVDAVNIVVPTITLCSSVTTTSSVVVTANDTQMLVNGLPVFTGTVPPADTSNWANYPAVATVNMSGFGIQSTTDLSLSSGGSIYLASSSNIKVQTKMETKGIEMTGLIEQTFAGGGSNYFESAVQIGNSGILPTNQFGTLAVYGGNVPVGLSTLYIKGGTTLDGGGVVHGITIGTLPVAGINTQRIDVLPVGIEMTTPTFITMNGLGAMNAAMGGAIAFAAGSYITLEHNFGLGQNGIFVQNSARDSTARMIFTAGGTLYNLTTLQASNIINPNGVQFWNGVYNPSGGAVIAPVAFGRSVVDLSTTSAYLANLTGGELPATKNTKSVFIGNLSNLTTSGVAGTIAIGDIPNMSGQGTNTIAIGTLAGQTSQKEGAVAIGYQAGISGQNTASIAIGNTAGGYQQGNGCVALGVNAGQLGQGQFAIAVGSGAGATNQGAEAFALGGSAGGSNQGIGAVALGTLAGLTSQGAGSVAVGSNAGGVSQGGNSIAIGNESGSNTQGINSVAIGWEAGQENQGSNSVAVGWDAGFDTQAAECVAVGHTAGLSNQGASSVAVGANAGYSNLGSNSVAVGAGAAGANSGTYVTAVGYNAGRAALGSNSIAIGAFSANAGMGEFSTYIGTCFVTESAVPTNTIVLNNTGIAMNPANNNSFYVGKVRSVASSAGFNMVAHNNGTGEFIQTLTSSLSMDSTISNTQRISYDTGLLKTQIDGLLKVAGNAEFTQSITANTTLNVLGLTTLSSLVIQNLSAGTSAKSVYYNPSLGVLTQADAPTPIVASPAFVYYVATNGRVGGSGSITDPLSTINGALAKTASTGGGRPGMTIFIAPGAYSEDVVVNISATLPAVSIIGMSDDDPSSKRVQITGSFTINGTDATFTNTIDTVVLNNLNVNAKDATTSAITITGAGIRVYLKNGLYTNANIATVPLISLSSTGVLPSTVAQLAIDDCSLTMDSATASGHIINVASGQIFSIGYSDLTHKGTGSAINMAGGAFGSANNSSFNATGAVMTLVMSAASLTSLTNCLVAGKASTTVALITLGTNANLNLTDSTVQNLDTSVEVNNTSRYIYTTSATGNLIASIRNNITNSRATATQITPFQAAVPAASQLFYFANIYTNQTGTLIGNLPSQGGLNWNAVRQFNTDTYTQQIQVVATSASAIVLTPTARGKTFILTGITTQAFSTTGFGTADAGFFVMVHNGNATGGGDINMTGMTGTAIVHNRTATQNGGIVYLYWTGAGLVGY